MQYNPYNKFYTDHGNNTISFYYSGTAVNVDLSYDNGDTTIGVKRSAKLGS